jgi:amino acid permease
MNEASYGSIGAAVPPKQEEPTSNFLTTANIVKSFVGLGVLAAPSGYQMVGFLPATVMILINGFVNTYTVHLQTRVKDHFGSEKVKNYTDLGEVCFGSKGLLLFSVTIIVNQVLTCTGYVKFFIEQLDILTRQVLSHERLRYGSDQDLETYNYKSTYVIVSFVVLGILS